MAHISKWRLADTDLQKLFTQLNHIIGTLNESRAGVFLSELLGTEEKIMLAKRFAVIVMLIEKQSTYRVSLLLHMSSSTVERIRNNYRRGDYKTIEQYITRDKKKYAQLLDVLETILRAGMPPRGRGRWARVFKR